MKAVILLGGFGTRLRPLTCDIPKPLIPLLNRPALNYQVDMIRRSGIKEIIFCTGYMSSMFKKYFPEGRKYGVRIRHSLEKIPLGTGGAIKNAQKYIDEPVVVFNGDVLTDLDLKDMIRFHRKNRSFVSISLVRVNNPTIYGLVETSRNGRIERFLEKPSWDEVTCNTINAGTYIFEPGVLDYIPPAVNYSVERGLFPMLLEKNKNVYGYVSDGYWLDIGTIEKYLKANHDLLRGEFRQSEYYSKTGGRKLFRARSARIDRTVSLDGRAVVDSGTRIGEFVGLSGMVSIGRNCVIHKRAQIMNSVILNNTVIGESAHIEGAVVGQRCRIDANVVLKAGSAVGSNSHITRYSRL